MIWILWPVYNTKLKILIAWFLWRSCSDSLLFRWILGSLTYYMLTVTDYELIKVDFVFILIINFYFWLADCLSYDLLRWFWQTRFFQFCACVNWDLVNYFVLTLLLYWVFLLYFVFLFKWSFGLSKPSRTMISSNLKSPILYVKLTSKYLKSIFIIIQ